MAGAITVFGKTRDLYRANDAAARLQGLSYSRLINGLNRANVDIDRKVLADIAVHDPEAFGAIAEQAKAALASAD